ncbi:Dolichyl-phosphate-mannose-protein mannosyltransferase [Sphingomonas sp. NFR04]|uniref:glycosyltransferase family 39 protein n=1 Tax=Sphingomonas sp. NFR04 TaxID=1566283 RepID=UPI0008DF6431|nr:glycosyltransferase family 39 protein [Sphingomonas sp. NFR04]SFK36079.1 Dolichyl-phosphate-mannose-protein mannosyltransferase [Sphingomonas sp. NFR04]
MSEALRWKPSWVLAILVVVALWLRLPSIGFGLPALNDPDELMFELGAIRMLRGHTLNPGWFGHPATTTMYVLAVVNVLVGLGGWLCGRFASLDAFGTAVYADPSWIILPGRLAMTAFALGTILLTYRLARRLAGAEVALIAAAVLTLSPVHITYSQIIRSDMMACFFMLLVMLAALNIAERGRWRDHVLAAFWLGCAITTKWPFALSFLPVAGGIWLYRHTGAISLRAALARTIATGLAALLFCALLSPYLVLDHATVVRNLTGESQARHLGSTGGSLWFNARWYLTGPLSTGLSIAGLLLLAPGIAVAGRRPRMAALLLPLLASFFVLLCTQTMVWERWAMPILPICAILVALGLCRVVAPVGARWRIAAGVLAAAAVAVPLATTSLAQARERMHDTRQRASAWAIAHIPPGSSVLVEHFAFDLLPQPWHFLFPMAEAGCVDAAAKLHGKIGYGSIDQARGTRANVDYGTVAAAKRDTCRADFAILTQYERYKAERSAFPEEYAAYRDYVARGKTVARFVPQPGETGGRIVTIVDFRGAHDAPR